MSTSGASKSAFCQITVDFPVGESNFTYDPTVGFGGVTLASGSGSGFVYNSGLNFTGNATLAESFSNFNYRLTSVAYKDMIFVETSDQINFSGSSGFVANEMFVVGVGSLTNVPPTIVVAMANQKGLISLSPSSSSFSFFGASGVAGFTFDTLQEVTKNGEVLNSTLLSSLTFTSTGTQNPDPSQGLNYVSYAAGFGTSTIAITFAVSAVVGTLNYGGAVITPTSVEAFFEINGYNLVDSSNHLRLIAYAGLSSKETVVNATTNLMAGSGNNQTFIEFSESVYVNGTTLSQSASVSGFSNTNYPASPTGSYSAYTLYEYLNTANLGAVAFCEVIVDFPMGQGSFTYDPSAGFAYPASPSPTLTPTPTPSTTSSAPTAGSGSTPNDGAGLIPASFLHTLAIFVALWLCFFA